MSFSVTFTDDNFIPSKVILHLLFIVPNDQAGQEDVSQNELTLSGTRRTNELAVICEVTLPFPMPI